ncbi:MAG: phosphodiester glycosidase family protein [Clostridia bacterium]
MKRELTLLTILVLLLSLTMPVLAEDEPVDEPIPHIVTMEAAELDAPKLTFLLPETSAPYGWRLVDGYVMSRVAIPAGQSITVSFETEPQGVLFKWYTAPTGGMMTQLDAHGASLSETAFTDPEQLNIYRLLDPNCRSFMLTVESDCALSETRVYAANEPLPDEVQTWGKNPEKADLMLILSEPGPEFSELSGVLPLYAGAHDIETVVIYLSTFGKRARTDEALAGLWAAGLTGYPVFYDATARNYDMLSIVQEDWGQSRITGKLAELIDTYQPEVIVTHDGEDQSDRFPTRGFTGRCTQNAVQQADWPVKKLYQYAPADAEGNPAVGGTMPDFLAPLAHYAGKTAQEVAQACYLLYETQQVYTRTIDSKASFVLAASTVGDDVAKDDLFEHIDKSMLRSYEEYGALATPDSSESEPNPTQQVETGAPEQQQNTGLTSAQGRPSQQVEQTANPRNLLPLAAGVMVTLVLLLLLHGHMDKTWAVLLAFIPIVASVVLYFVLGGTLWLNTIVTGYKHEQMTVTQSESREPTVAPTVTPQPTAAATPESTPIVASALEDTFFRQTGEPAEVIVYDSEHGHWEYRTDLLSILIDRVNTTTVNDKPLAYYVADIRMKDVYQFRPAFGSDGHTGMGAIYPWIIARRANAVLWVTGDNMVNSDRSDKGVIIRDGRIYLDEEIEDTMAIYPDLSLHIYKKWNQDAEQMLEDGVENTFSFGPTLVENGVVNPDARKHRVRRANPRVGIGMMEPGHYIVIVADGRQKNYSVGMTVEDFAELFVEYGCLTAYNMDGGLSAGMIFMGEQLNSHGSKRTGSKNDLSYQRPVPDGLIFGYSEQVPDVNDPIYNDGNIAK